MQAIEQEHHRNDIGMVLAVVDSLQIYVEEQRQEPY